jgi:L-threonylcarbamoyladenylate synthase
MILDDSDQSMQLAAEAIRGNQLVAFPTETVYGLAANAFSDSAVGKIFSVKQRPHTSPLIIHCCSIEQALALVNVDALSSSNLRLFDALSAAYWPGPLAIVMPSKGVVSTLATAGQQTVAIRIPSHPLALKLIKEAGCPLAAPSANLHKYVSPTSAQHVEDQLGDSIAYVVDGGACLVGVESTIISLVSDTPALLRHGGVTQEELQAICPELQTQQIKHSDITVPQLSAGLLTQHYSPKTLTKFYSPLDDAGLPPAARLGILSFNSSSEINALNCAVNISLSNDGCHLEIAQKLFSGLRELDAHRLDLILLDSVEKNGLGRAIMDRLERAASN